MNDSIDAILEEKASLNDQQDALHGATEEISETSPKETFHGSTVELIPVEQIAIDYESLVRPIDMDACNELALKDHQKWDPLEIDQWPTDPQKPKPAETVLYRVVSGNHRFTAIGIKAENVKAIRCIRVDASDEKKYLIAAVSSNVNHGRNFTRQEYIDIVKRLEAQRVSRREIVSLLGYSAATISRMISGADAHAAEKARAQEPEVPEPEPPQEPPQPILQLATGTDAVKKKIAGLLVASKVGASNLDAKQYVTTQLSVTQQQELGQLLTWLKEVLS